MSTDSEDQARKKRARASIPEHSGSAITFGLLLLYLFAIPLKFQAGWILPRIQLALFIVIVVRVIAGLDRVEFTRTQLIVVAVLSLTLCVTILGQIVAVRGENLRKIPQVTRFLVLGLACVLELDSVDRLRKFLAAATTVAVMVSLLSIMNLIVTLPFAFTGQVRSLGPISFGIPRSLGIWMSFGSFGVLAVIGASYAGISALRPTPVYGDNRGKLTRTLATVSLGLILVGVFLGQSRSTILAFLIVGAWALAVAAFHPDSRLRAATPAIPAGLLLGGLVGVGIKSGTLVESLVGTNTASITGRIDQYQLATELMLQRPLLGWGFQYFETAFGTSYSVHNMWFLLGVALGVPVFLSWVYVFYRLWRDAFRQVTSDRSQVRVFGILGVAMLAGGVVELALYPGFTPIAAVLAGALVGIVGLGTG